MPKMTRAHFQLIADVVKAADLSRADRQHMALMFSNTLQATNPHFNRIRFIEACGSET